MSVEKSDVSHVLNFYDKAARCPSANSLSHRRQTRILCLRNFNNWVKSVLITYYVERARKQFGSNVHLRILDLCCGKGGDQLKWAKSNVSHVTFIDLSGASIEACKQRYESLRGKRYQLYTADFHVADCTSDLTKGNLSGRTYELISCQFSLHYAFESITQAHCTLANISHCLPVGGYFIATIPNAYEIVRRANMAYASRESVDKMDGGAQEEEQNISFGNSVYSVRFHSESFSIRPSSDFAFLHFPLFGARYDFHLEGVVDCPEFLVYPPLLSKLAEEHHLVPVCEPIPFGQYFWKSLVDHATRDNPVRLLMHMDALETLRTPRHSPLEADHQEAVYNHVAEKLATDDACRCSRLLGTISKEQWDVVTLYSVVAFQKV